MMNSMDFESMLGNMDVAYESATPQDSGHLPDGRYNAILKEASLKEGKNGLRLLCSYVVTDGQYAGRLIFDGQNISPESLGYFKSFLEKLGINLTRLSALPKSLPMFSGRMVTLRLVTSRKNNAEYQNAYLDKFIGMGNLADYTRARNASAQAGPVDSDGFTVIEEEDLPFN